MEIIIIAIALTCFFFLPEFQLYYFDRSAINEHYELWRLISAHFTHVDRLHFASNMAGFLILACLYIHFKGKHLLTISLVCSLLVSVLLYYFSPYVERYSGFSAVLNALFIICLLQIYYASNNKKLLIVLLIYLLKLLTDQINHPLHFTNIAWPALGIAHLYGALAGLVIYIFFLHRPIKSKLTP